MYVPKQIQPDLDDKFPTDLINDPALNVTQGPFDHVQDNDYQREHLQHECVFIDKNIVEGFLYQGHRGCGNNTNDHGGEKGKNHPTLVRDKIAYQALI